MINICWKIAFSSTFEPLYHFHLQSHRRSFPHWQFYIRIIEFCVLIEVKFCVRVLHFLLIILACCYSRFSPVNSMIRIFPNFQHLCLLFPIMLSLENVTIFERVQLSLKVLHKFYETFCMFHKKNLTIMKSIIRELS